MVDFKKIVKNMYITVRYYSFGKSNIKGNKVVFFIEEGYGQPHPGLVDRFKAIIGLYHVAQESGFEFKLQYTSPFHLEEYLLPGQVDWLCRNGEISYKAGDVRMLTYEAAGEIPALEKCVPQYHCYLYEGLNILRAQNVENWEKKWHTYFHKLFAKSEKLEKLLGRVRPGKPFSAVHIRFVNALDSFEKGYESNLSQEEKQALIESCLMTLSMIRKKEEKLIYVFSDSARFLEIAGEHGFMSPPSEHIGHISFQGDRQVYEKTFMDFFLMSEADQVYALQGPHLYNSVFSQYAAIVGDKPYEVIRTGS